MSCNQKNNDDLKNCPCDQFLHPKALIIDAGQTVLNRQIATFPEFRLALLKDIRMHPELTKWKGRSDDDLGIMLLEMWAYVCDVTSFYDKIIAQECYIRTTNLRPSLRKLIALLGYLPRPALASKIDLMAIAEGNDPFSIPSRTAFRSVDTQQVFETEEQQRVDPMFNSWSLERPLQPLIKGITNTLVVELRTDIENGQTLMLEEASGEIDTLFVNVISVKGKRNINGDKYHELVLEESIDFTEKGVPALGIFLYTIDKSHTINSYNIDANQIEVLGYAYELGNDDDLILQEGNQYSIKKFDTITHPNANNFNTSIELNSDSTINSDSQNKTLFKKGIIAAKLKEQYKDQITFNNDESYLISQPYKVPRDSRSPNDIFIRDADQQAYQLNGNIDHDTRKLKIFQNYENNNSFFFPIDVFGNVLYATEGSSVLGEVLGSGDPTISNQFFTLSQKPLTHTFEPTTNDKRGISSTLEIYVDDVRWKEVSSFYDIGPHEQVYIVRQDDEENSTVTFGNGIYGSLLPTGSDNIVANYRFGAGDASASSGTVSQIDTPIPGLQSVDNPLPTFGGKNREAPEKMKKWGPKSILIFDRAISLADFEAATNLTPGVESANASWVWSHKQQRPVVQIAYIGSNQLKDIIHQYLLNITAPNTPIEIITALPVTVDLNIDLSIKDVYIENKVITKICNKLTNEEDGVLIPANVGIGQFFIRSQLYEQLRSFYEVQSINHIQWNEENFNSFAMNPGDGAYYDFLSGKLSINGNTCEI